MSIERNDPVFLSSDNGRHQPELMISAVLHLMSHYTAGNGGSSSNSNSNSSSDGGPCVKLASVIERHFKALASLPDLAPVLRATCQQLSEQWADIVERDMPRPKKNNILRRMLAASKAGMGASSVEPSNAEPSHSRSSNVDPAATVASRSGTAHV
jgi:hypothetical protein